MAVMLCIAGSTQNASAKATEYTYEDFSYIIDTGAIEITAYNGNSANVEIPSTIDHDGTSYKVRSIGRSAFAGNEKLETIVISENIAEIGDLAFKDCVNLSSVTVNGTIDRVSNGGLNNPFVNAGSNSDSLTVEFGSGVKTIARNMFNTNAKYDSGNGRYVHVTKVTIADSVTVVGDSAFSGCYDLKDVSWGSGLTAIGRSAFRETAITEVLLPAGMTELGDIAFEDCVKLNSIKVNGTIDEVSNGGLSNPFVNAGAESDSLTVEFGSGVKKIATNMFNTNKNYESGNGRYAHITKAVIADSVTVVGDSAFSGCYDLKDVSWGSGLTAIGRSAFRETAITEVLLPAGMTELGDIAFEDCVKLNSIKVNGTIDEVSNWGLSNPFVNAGAESDSLTVEFGSGVKKIATNMFNTNKNYESGNGRYAHITKAVIADSVTEIGSSAFAGCYDLKDIEPGKGLEKIDTSSFSDCNSIADIKLPHTLKSIGNFAFYGTSGLKTLYYDGLKSDWSKVEVGTDNTGLAGASILYNIAYAPVKVSNSFYDGTEQKPDISVYDGDTLLADGKDYEKSYSNNIEIGTASVVIRGTGDYFGSVSATFSIMPPEDVLPVGAEKVTKYGTVKVISENTTVAFVKAKNKASVTVPSTVLINGNKYKVTEISAKAFTGKKISTITIGKNVSRIRKNAFKGSKATKLIIKTKLLKKSKVKGSLKGSRIKTIKVKVGSKAKNKKYIRLYKKIFTKSNAGRKVAVK